MSGRYLTELADVLRAAGVTVVEYEGWQTRARSSGGYSSGRPTGCMWHHTASQTTPANDADYMCHGSSDRPIANMLIPRDGTVWVLAAGATNTNGKGGPWGRWSRGTIPADSMNLYAVSLELANNGVGEPYPQAQIDAAFAASVAVVRAYGLDPGDICTHYEWAPTRKIDPATADAVQGPWRPRSATSSGTWNLDDLIAEHRRRYEGDDDMPTADEIAQKVWEQPVGNQITGSQTDPAWIILKAAHAEAYEAHSAVNDLERRLRDAGVIP